tara:strand:- start:6383 stop:6745 length:363 start_codon:yes stop_codon:yes gene_type:complete
MRLTFSNTQLWFGIIFACIAYLLVPMWASAETVVTNSVSVSASDSGESRASVTTTINGETIEQWSSVGTSTSYKSTVTDNTLSSLSISETPSEAQQLLTLQRIIDRLLAIINTYEAQSSN